MVYLSVTYQIQIHIQIQQNIHLIPSLLGLRDTIIWHVFSCFLFFQVNQLYRLCRQFTI